MSGSCLTPRTTVQTYPPAPPAAADAECGLYPIWQPCKSCCADGSIHTGYSQSDGPQQYCYNGQMFIVTSLTEDDNCDDPFFGEKKTPATWQVDTLQDFIRRNSGGGDTFVVSESYDLTGTYASGYSEQSVTNLNDGSQVVTDISHMFPILVDKTLLTGAPFTHTIGTDGPISTPTVVSEVNIPASDLIAMGMRVTDNAVLVRLDGNVSMRQSAAGDGTNEYYLDASLRASGADGDYDDALRVTSRNHESESGPDASFEYDHVFEWIPLNSDRSIDLLFNVNRHDGPPSIETAIVSIRAKVHGFARMNFVPSA